MCSTVLLTVLPTIASMTSRWARLSLGLSREAGWSQAELLGLCTLPGLCTLLGLWTPLGFYTPLGLCTPLGFYTLLGLCTLLGFYAIFSLYTPPVPNAKHSPTTYTLASPGLVVIIPLFNFAKVIFYDVISAPSIRRYWFRLVRFLSLVSSLL